MALPTLSSTRWFHRTDLWASRVRQPSDCRSCRTVITYVTSYLFSDFPMDYIRQLGPVVLDHRFRRLTEALLRSAEEIYEARGLPFRGRWASTYQLLHQEGPLAVGQIAEQLRLTHPGVIGITDEMLAAELIDAVRDP